jgi:hypothetical protein
MTRSMLAAMTSLLVLSVSLSLLVHPSATEPRGNAAEGPAAINVERLLEDLGSDQFETREAATRALEALDDEPIGLRKGLKSPDLELRRRVDRILKSHVSKRARRGLAKAVTLAKEGRVEEMVERLILWNEWDQGKERGKAVAELAARAFEWEHRHFANLDSLWPSFKLATQRFRSRNHRAKYSLRELRELRELPSAEDVAEIWTKYKVICDCNIAGGEQSGRDGNTVYIASGDVRVPSLQNGVILALGNVEVSHANDTVIFCASDLKNDFKNDFKGKRYLSRCLIVANGEVTCPSAVLSSTIVAGRSIVVPKGTKIDNSAILKMNPPKSFVKFFDPEMVGLTVWQHYRDGKIVDILGIPVTGDGVWIKEVRKDSPFAASLNAEDVITAINEIKVPTKEIFRKVLRRKLAEGGPTLTFTVRRAGKTLDVPIAIKD